MNGTQVHTGYQPVHQEETSTIMTRSALMESIGAFATLVLAIAGLAGGFSTTLAAIATIVLGAAIWMEGGAVFASQRTHVSLENGSAETLQWSEGLGIEFLGGLSGIILGVLALLGIAPITLLSVAMLVFGATFLLNSKAGFGPSSQSMFGLAGLTLGLLAVCGVNPIILVLAGLVSLGTSALLNSAAGSKLALAFRK